MTAFPRLIRAHGSSQQALHRLGDAASVLGGVAASAPFAPLVSVEQFALAGAAAIIGFSFTGEMSGMYRDWRGVSTEREALCAFSTWSVALAGLLLINYLAGSMVPLPLLAVATWWATTPLAAISWRVVVRAAQRVLRSRGYNSRRFAIVGVNELAIQLAENIQDSPELGLVLTGFFDDRPKERVGELPPHIGRRLGDLDDLVRQTREGRVDRIYLTFPMRAEDRIKEVLQRLGDTTASVYIVPDFFVFELLHSRWTSINGLPVVSVFETPFYGVDSVVKRTMDLVLAGTVLTLASIPMAVLAALIKCTSSGPVFFRQRRYGLDGKGIRVWKFRTMTVCEDGNQVQQATKNDERVTPLGRILRKTSLDELPQLLNVLAGEMSLVGPRPHATAHNEQYRRRIRGYMLRHKVRPGITGLAQVEGCRGETKTLDKMEKRVQYDHQYIREWSLWLDVKILFRTLLVVFSRNNAY